MFIYVIKLFKDEDNDTLNCGNAGYFKTFESALNIIEKNSLDLSDCGYYDYVVILKIPDGLYSICFSEEEVWFCWDNGKYIECKKPEQLSGFAFSI